jgi:F-type H+-transporting ATPase subunit gamma
MPSLKDLKNRIGSVKNTRKITKAMQMVAAAKLRRAQDAAEAARPYAERMTTVMSGLAQRAWHRRPRTEASGRDGKDQVHLLVVMTSERGLCGGFNSSIVRWPASGRIERLAARQDGQDPDRRQEGPRTAEARLGRPFVGHVDLARSSASAMPMRRRSRAMCLAALRCGRIRRGDDLLQPLPVGDQPGPDRAAGHPGQVRSRGNRRSTTTNRRKRRSWPTCCRAAWRRRSSPRSWKTGLGTGRADVRDGQRDRNAGDMINKLTIQYNRSRQAAITKELIEIISGAEAL